MKIRFGVNFEFKLSRDMPPEVHIHEAHVESATERRPSYDAGDDDAGILPDEDRVAPVSKSVIGFVGTPPGVAGRMM